MGLQADGILETPVELRGPKVQAFEKAPISQAKGQKISEVNDLINDCCAV